MFFLEPKEIVSIKQSARWLLISIDKKKVWNDMETILSRQVPYCIFIIIYPERLNRASMHKIKKQ